MKKIILTEIILLFVIASLSVALYKLIYGINLRYDNYFDMLMFEARRMTVVLEIIGVFFLPILISFSIARQVYYKFLKRYLAFEILVASLLLAGLLFYKYLFLSSDNAVMAKEGWTIYPPLTGLSVLDEHDAAKLQIEQNLLLIEMGAVLLISFVLTLVTFRRRKSRGA